MIKLRPAVKAINYWLRRYYGRHRKPPPPLKIPSLRLNTGISFAQATTPARLWTPQKGARRCPHPPIQRSPSSAGAALSVI